MTEKESEVRRQIIAGEAAPEEAERFVADLENAVVSALEEAAAAKNRLARHMNAAAELTRTLPQIAGEDDRLTRLTLAEEGDRAARGGHWRASATDLRWARSWGSPTCPATGGESRRA